MTRSDVAETLIAILALVSILVACALIVLQTGCITVQRGAVEVYVQVGPGSPTTQPAWTGPDADFSANILKLYRESVK